MMIIMRFTQDYGNTFFNKMRQFFGEEDGATAVEYALMIALLAGAVMGSQQALGQTVETMYVDAMGLIVGAMGS